MTCHGRCIGAVRSGSLAIGGFKQAFALLGFHVSDALKRGNHVAVKLVDDLARPLSLGRVTLSRFPSFAHGGLAFLSAPLALIDSSIDGAEMLARFRFAVGDLVTDFREHFASALLLGHGFVLG